MIFYLFKQSLHCGIAVDGIFPDVSISRAVCVPSWTLQLGSGLTVHAASSFEPSASSSPWGWMRGLDFRLFSGGCSHGCRGRWPGWRRGSKSHWSMNSIGSPDAPGADKQEVRGAADVKEVRGGADIHEVWGATASIFEIWGAVDGIQEGGGAADVKEVWGAAGIHEGGEASVGIQERGGAADVKEVWGAAGIHEGGGALDGIQEGGGAADVKESCGAAAIHEGGEAGDVSMSDSWSSRMCWSQSSPSSMNPPWNKLSILKTYF